MWKYIWLLPVALMLGVMFYGTFSYDTPEIEQLPTRCETTLPTASTRICP